MIHLLDVKESKGVSEHIVVTCSQVRISQQDDLTSSEELPLLVLLTQRFSRITKQDSPRDEPSCCKCQSNIEAAPSLMMFSSCCKEQKNYLDIQLSYFHNFNNTVSTTTLIKFSSPVCTSLITCIKKTSLDLLNHLTRDIEVTPVESETIIYEHVTHTQIC